MSGRQMSGRQMSGRFPALLSGIVLLLMLRSVSGDEPEGAASQQTPAAASVSTETAGVQFEDDFSYAADARQIQVDGGEPVIEGDVHSNIFTFARLPRGVRGHLKLIMTEDHTVMNPEGAAGVLRMEIAEVPTGPSVLGFVYQGNETSGEITMPGWERGQITLNDLRRAFITFRFRAENREDPDVMGATFRLRFEPGVSNSHEFGADFGSLIATNRWRTFRRPLASAENLQAFLEVVNGEDPETFKLVWSQANNILDYRPGDSLLIDDLRISIE